MDDSDYTIFVVDDDVYVRDALRALINSAGFNVEVFESAQAFLNSGHHQRKGLLVLDVRMPGMSGIELQRILAERGSCMPIVFITAHENNLVRSKAMAAGAVAFLQKPFEDHVLLDVIQGCFVA